ncbi:MAG: hypothetical protein JWO91_2621, partial [Acidobacteriaceae bacterium]|nr:hypothetical protein [Acidobacteriaceae bacterium]
MRLLFSVLALVGWSSVGMAGLYPPIDESTVHMLDVLGKSS